jgi:hypothetical protein
MKTTIFFLLISLNAFSQNIFLPKKVQKYYSDHNSLQQFYENNDYNQCIKILKKNHKIKKSYDEFEYLLYSKCLIGKGDTFSSVKMLLLGIEKGLFWDEGSQFTNLTNQDEYSLDFLNKYIYPKYSLYHNFYINNLDSINIKLINMMVKDDQRIRSSPDKDIVKWGSRINSVDSINFIKLKEIFSKYDGKIPPSHKIGRKSLNNILLILHHVSTQKKYFDECSNLIYQSCVDFNTNPVSLAAIYDRSSLDLNHCAIYGEMTTNVNGIQSIVLCDCEKIDQLRYNLGLETLTDFSKRRQIALPDCYKSKTLKK